MYEDERAQDEQATPEPPIHAAPVDPGDGVDALESAVTSNIDETGADIVSLDDSLGDAGPEAAVSESLRNALEQMRDESRRIADLGTGDEQVGSAERFADAAATLDEQIGSTARAEDEHGR